MESLQHRLVTILFLICCLCAPARGESGRPEDTKSTGAHKPKLSGELRITASPFTPESLGDKHLGTVRGSDSRIILNDGRGNRLLDLDFGWQHNPDASRDILLPERSHFAGGFVLPLPGNIRFRQVFNRSLVDSGLGTDYTALGSYLSGSHKKLAWKFGREQDSRHTVLHYGMGEYRLHPRFLVAGGASFTQTLKEGTKKGVLREGVGFSWTLPNTKHQLMGGVVGAQSAAARPTYIGGVGRCADRKASGPDPNYVFLYRNREESQYVLGIVTLSGKSLQCSVNESIFSAFLEGGLGPVRIVNNRNFDTLGIGGSYRTQEYGRVVLAVSLGRTHITQTVSRMFADVEAYYTFDRKNAMLLDPYVGLGYSGGEDVFFDTTAAHPRLASRYSDVARVTAGAKFHLWGRTMRFALTPQVDLRTRRPGGAVELSAHF